MRIWKEGKNSLMQIIATYFKSEVRSQKIMELIFKILRRKGFKCRVLIISQTTNQVNVWNKEFSDKQDLEKNLRASFLGQLLKYECLN